MENAPEVYAVAELNRMVRDLLSDTFGPIWVAGELSNLATPQSGHLYFTLKDKKSQVRCAFFRHQNKGLNFQLEEGQQVLVLAEVSLYEARGDYQLIVQQMEESGDGALRRAFEQLKQQLSEEGLFLDTHKQALPELPKAIGVITSPSGAAIRDVLSVLKRRFPIVPIIVYPAQVQGEEAARSLIRAIALANETPLVDVLILCRGGGSLEDLNAFNDEQLARAIFASHLPIVCGVGHEVDFTIADFVADVRAPTPSVAAELVVPQKEDLLEYLESVEQQLSKLFRRQLNQHAQALDHLSKRLVDPRKKLVQDKQHLESQWRQLVSNCRLQLATNTRSLQQIQFSLEKHHPEQRVELNQMQMNALAHRLEHSVQHQLKQQQSAFSALAQQIHSLSPLNTLARGYAIAQDVAGHTLKKAHDVEIGDKIEVRLSAGHLHCLVEGKTE